jgi:hypothetical protein
MESLFSWRRYEKFGVKAPRKQLETFLCIWTIIFRDMNPENGKEASEDYPSLKSGLRYLIQAVRGWRLHQ